jgi:thiamine biosynthesis lipoprotein
VRADRDAGTVVRRPGIRLDSGGIGKGLAADAYAVRLSRYTSFAVDCGGDLRIGGANGLARRVEVEHPLTGDAAHRFAIADGAVATSGLKRRVWRCPDGAHAHHLIDPARGRPAWTGLVQVTALAPSAVDAEWLAKAALLSGPDRARRLLADHGGALIDDRGEVEPVAAERAHEHLAAEVR